MQYVIIDPQTLVFDTEHFDKANMQGYIDRILETCDFNDYGFIQMLISESTIELLMSENDYPDWDVLKEVLVLCELHKIYQPKDIINALEMILKNPTVENITEIKDVLFSINRNKPVDSNVDIYLQELERLYVYCYLNKLKVGPTLFKGLEESTVEINCEILELDCSDLTLDLPLTVKEKLDVIDTLECLLLKMDCIEMWKRNFVNSNLKEAVNLYLMQNNIIKKNTWEIGDRFCELTKKYGFGTESYKIKMLLRAMVEIIGEFNLNKTHDLRENDSGASAQIIGKNGKAYRHDIDRDFHLHYWKNERKIIFASAGPHNNFFIPDK